MCLHSGIYPKKNYFTKRLCRSDEAQSILAAEIAKAWFRIPKVLSAARYLYKLGGPTPGGAYRAVSGHVCSAARGCHPLLLSHSMTATGQASLAVPDTSRAL